MLFREREREKCNTNKYLYSALTITDRPEHPIPVFGGIHLWHLRLYLVLLFPKIGMRYPTVRLTSIRWLVMGLLLNPFLLLSPSGPPVTKPYSLGELRVDGTLRAKYLI